MHGFDRGPLLHSNGGLLTPPKALSLARWISGRSDGFGQRRDPTLTEYE